MFWSSASSYFAPRKKIMIDNPLDQIVNLAENLGGGEIVEGLQEKITDAVGNLTEGPLGGMVEAAKDALGPITDTVTRIVGAKADSDES